MINVTALRLLVLSDPHIVTTPVAEMKGIDPLARLNLALDTALCDGEPPDLMVITGDLIMDGKAESYSLLWQTLKARGIPVCLLPGNHDKPDLLKKNLPDSTFQYLGSVRLPGWILIFLDSLLPGSHEGFIGPEEMARAEAVMRESPDTPAMLFAHVGPVDFCPHTDCNLQNRKAFLNWILAHPQIRGMVWGHGHCAGDKYIGGCRMMMTPSTSVILSHPQKDVAWEGKDFMAVHKLDPKRIGYRWIGLMPGGEIGTQVRWLTGPEKEGR